MASSEALPCQAECPIGHLVIIEFSQKQKRILLPNMKELFETNRMSHFPPFYSDFSYRNLTLKVGYFILNNLHTIIMKTRWNNEIEAGN